MRNNKVKETKETKSPDLIRLEKSREEAERTCMLALEAASLGLLSPDESYRAALAEWCKQCKSHYEQCDGEVITFGY